MAKKNGSEKKDNGTRGVFVKLSPEDVAAILKIQASQPFKPSFGSVVRAATTEGLKKLGR